MGAFDDNDGKPPQVRQRVGLKISNQNSVFSKVPKKPTPAESEQLAKAAINQGQSYKERAAELAVAFKKLLDDRVLPENKSIFATDLEREVIGKLAELGIDINHDENEEEGMGSIGLINLLFRSLLIQRDKINALDYAIHELQLKVNSLVDKTEKSG